MERELRSRQSDPFRGITGQAAPLAEAGRKSALATYKYVVEVINLEIFAIHGTVNLDYDNMGYNPDQWEQTELGGWYKEYSKWWEEFKSSGFDHHKTMPAQVLNWPTQFRTNE